MSTSFTGTVLNGAIQPDQPIALAEHSRVQVTVVPIEDWRQNLRSAIEGLDELKRTRPISSGGLRFTRDDLHERD